MKTTFTNKLLLSVGVAALALSAGTANAQTENVNASVTVQNTLTITEVDPLDFGTVAAISDAANQAQLLINPLTDAVTVVNNAPAVFAIIDATNATAANITVEDGADGAAININIDNVVDPVFGGNIFTLDDFNTSWNGGAATIRVINTPFSYVFLTAFGAGTNTLDIGAELETATGVTYADGVYAGSFDVTFSY
jgi:hypothetical protein